ncbi:hypothetical protein E1B28_009841 [Marasmius oreades]|uniref:F-box domain-containing protein n=1 Tax=Marasmius oreades TaxID=181124 RepID=A0A9P7US38_9AGAR|nr:uncharacterized protein E1B28_009841 [Marasmius oreades]KAG7090751.1 hypothetical protein E1B28_009841 [Marasmius oreades]
MGGSDDAFNGHSKYFDPILHSFLPSLLFDFVMPSIPSKSKRPRLSHLEHAIGVPHPTNFFSSRSTQVPCKVTLEIFQSLPGQDLLTMVRVNTSFRRILVSSSARFLWVRILEDDGCPRRPSWIEPSELVFFLYKAERFKCQCCRQWRGVVLNPIYIAFEWLCRVCSGKALCSQQDLGVNLPVHVYDLIPSISGHKGQTLYLKKFAHHASAHLQSGRNLGELRTQYKEVVKLARECKVWMDHRAEIQQKADMRQRWVIIQRKLFVLGFNDNDLATVSVHPLVRTVATLRDRDWTAHIYPQLKLVIDSHRRASMFANPFLDNAISDRIKGFKKFFWNVLSSLPLERRDFPDSQTVCLLPICADIIIQPDNVHVTQETFKALRSPILHDTRLWIRQQQQQLTKIFIEGRHRLLAAAHSVGLDVLLPFETRWYTGIACHELAVAQYMCLQCERRYPTARAAIRHLNNAFICRPGTAVNLNSFAFSPDRTVLLLLKLSRLLATTTADDFDFLDPTFRCLNCSDEPHVGKWRQCLSHHNSRHAQSDPKFERLPNGHPMTRAPSYENRWACARCYDNCGSSRAEVECHVREVHAIGYPKVPRDFYHCEL